MSMQRVDPRRSRPQDETRRPPDGRATLYYVLRDGRLGVDWWWISVEVPPPPARDPLTPRRPTAHRFHGMASPQ
jgi:hypothetical protein